MKHLMRLSIGSQETCSSNTERDIATSRSEEVSDWESFRQFVLEVIIASFDKINDKVATDAKARSDRTVRPANYPISDVVNVVCSSEIQDLKLLRNEIAHGELGKAKHTMRLGEIYMQAVGVSYITPEDASRWSEMQLFIMKFLEAYREYEALRAAALSQDSNLTLEPTNAGTLKQEPSHQTSSFRLVE